MDCDSQRTCILLLARTIPQVHLDFHLFRASQRGCGKAEHFKKKTVEKSDFFRQVFGLGILHIMDMTFTIDQGLRDTGV